MQNRLLYESLDEVGGVVLPLLVKVCVCSWGAAAHTAISNMCIHAWSCLLFPCVHFVPFVYLPDSLHWFCSLEISFVRAKAWILWNADHIFTSGQINILCNFRCQFCAVLHLKLSELTAILTTNSFYMKENCNWIVFSISMMRIHYNFYLCIWQVTNTGILNISVKCPETVSLFVFSSVSTCGDCSISFLQLCLGTQSTCDCGLVWHKKYTQWLQTQYL